MSMLPPTSLSHLQGSTTSTTSTSSYPSNAQAPASANGPTPPSSQSQTSILERDSQDLKPAAKSAGNASYQQRAGSEPRPSTSRSTSNGSRSPTHGTKRTANGLIKPSPDLYPRGFGAGHKMGHSRHTSLDTSSSTISELSAQLKSRLSYAMRKVQAARSQTTSPASTTSASMGGTSAFSSPGTTYSDPSRQSKALSQILESREAEESNTWQVSSQKSKTSESYERGQPMPSLAPAPTITASAPSSQSRRTTNGAQAPQLKKSQSSDAQQTHLAVPRAGTPTQQEQDAVDTLLFMSSPRNTGRYRDGAFAPSQQSTAASPRRHNDRSLMPPLQHMNSTSSEEDSLTLKQQAKRRSLGLGTFVPESERDVDAMLDRIATERGSDGESLDGVQYHSQGVYAHAH